MPPGIYSIPGVFYCTLFDASADQKHLAFHLLVAPAISNRHQKKLDLAIQDVCAAPAAFSAANGLRPPDAYKNQAQ
jgi:hypothetical protein